MDWLSKPIEETVKPLDICPVDICYQIDCRDRSGCGINGCIKKSCVAQY